jgi:hypothetical protein
MNPSERRLQVDLAAARYLDALEREDFSTMAELWKAAAGDDALQAAFRDVHKALLEELWSHQLDRIKERAEQRAREQTESPTPLKPGEDNHENGHF